MRLWNSVFFNQKKKNLHGDLKMSLVLKKTEKETNEIK